MAVMPSDPDRGIVVNIHAKRLCSKNVIDLDAVSVEKGLLFDEMPLHVQQAWRTIAEHFMSLKLLPNFVVMHYSEREDRYASPEIFPLCYMAKGV